ncbi:armadillo-type protein [Choanephora cucurbitarum]|nr:armadillo-type protein [Choanephora cucurbitarum]
MQGSEQKDILHPEIQIYYLTALIHLIQHSPQQVTINELYKLMVPIISALSTEDPHLVQSTLRVVQHIVPNAQDLVIQHLGSFIHALLRITQSHTATARILALDCLCEIARKGKSDILSPFKPSVVKELGVALDDKKRAVRKHAVDCRETWFTIGK